MNKALFVSAALIAGWLAGATPAQALVVAGGTCTPDNTWNDAGNPGVWNDPGNWSTGASPVNDACAGFSGTATVGEINVGNGGTGSLVISGGTLSANPVDLGVNLGDRGTITQTGGTLNDDMIVGDAGAGSYTNNNATHNVTGNLILGNQSTGNGTYNLNNGGTLTVSNNMLVGNGGVGVFNQVAGPVTSGTPQVSGGAAGVEGDVVIGAQSGSQGTYNLGDATAQSPNLTVNGSIIIGRDPGSNGATVPGATPTKK